MKSYESERKEISDFLKKEGYRLSLHDSPILQDRTTGRRYVAYRVICMKDGAELNRQTIETYIRFKLLPLLKLKSVRKMRTTEAIYRYAPEIHHALTLFPLPLN